MNIRPYTKADTEAIVNLSLRAWAPVFASMEETLSPALFRSFFPDWRAHQQKAVENALADGEQYVQVYEVEGKIAGFVAVRLHAEDCMGEIHMVAVDPDHQRRGIASALTHTAMEWMRESGMDVAMVETGGDPGHGPARRTYERAGFELMPIARYFRML